MSIKPNHLNHRPARLLVALDGSQAARTALPIARSVAEQLGVQLNILHVSPTSIPEEVVRSRLALEESDLEGAKLYLHLGEAALGILEMTNDPRTELVVLTTHGRVIEARQSLGRVAEEVIATCRQPILLVRPESSPATEGGRAASGIHRMLFPLDGTPTTFSALRPAMSLASRLGASVDLLYVLSPGQPIPVELGSIVAPRYVDQPQHEWPHWSRAAVQHLIAQAQCSSTVPVQAFLAIGETSAEILRFADEHQVDTIVLVRHSQLEAHRAHVLRAVLAHTPCSLLLLGVPSAPSSGVGHPR